MAYSYIKPYTKKGQYFAGDSGLSEQDFLQQRASGTLSNQNRFSPNGGTTNYNTPTTNVIDLRLPGSITGSGTNDAPWYASQQQATPDGIFALNKDRMKANFGMGWTNDENIANTSKAIPQMLGYDEATGKYDMSKGSILGGPGQAYSNSTLAELQALGSQALQRTNQATFAGIANANAARGGTGLNSASMMAGRDAYDRGALARADLDARTKGLELGVSQHAGRLGAFNQVSNLADSNAQRMQQQQTLDFSKLLADKSQMANAVENARQAMNNFATQHATELVQSSGSKDTGKQAKDLFRKQLQDLQRQYQYAQANYSQYA